MRPLADFLFGVGGFAILYLIWCGASLVYSVVVARIYKGAEPMTAEDVQDELRRIEKELQDEMDS